LVRLWQCGENCHNLHKKGDSNKLIKLGIPEGRGQTCANNSNISNLAHFITQCLERATENKQLNMKHKQV
jgi:hypothetical protein